jgi:hypothetical protein
MNVINLFNRQSSVVALLKCKDTTLFQNFKRADSRILYQAPVICIAKLNDGTYSPVCIIDNEIKIMNSTSFIMTEFLVSEKIVNFEKYCQKKKSVDKVKDQSETYIWLSDSSCEPMSFFKVAYWEVLVSGFIKATYYKEDGNIDYVDNLLCKKIYCSQHVYNSMNSL